MLHGSSAVCREIEACYVRRNRRLAFRVFQWHEAVWTNGFTSARVSIGRSSQWREIPVTAKLNFTLLGAEANRYRLKPTQIIVGETSVPENQGSDEPCP